jgi:hypothetical protein
MAPTITVDCCNAHATSELGQVRPSCAIDEHGGLSPDSFRGGVVGYLIPTSAAQRPTRLAVLREIV